MRRQRAPSAARAAELLLAVWVGGAAAPGRLPAQPDRGRPRLENLRDMSHDAAEVSQLVSDKRVSELVNP